MKRIIIALFGVVVLVGIAVAVSKQQSQTSPQAQESQSAPQNTDNTSQAPDASQAAATIQMFDDRYEPKTLTIKKGEAVKFVNSGNKPHWPASNIHPTHEIYPEFDPRRGIDPGSDWEFRFDQAGEWRYHDHLFPGLTGSITVE